MNQQALLSSIPFFSNLDPDALTTLASHMRLRKFRRNQPIFDQGDPGDCLFIISAGRVKLFIETGDGDQLTILHCGTGECFGEMAVLDGQPRSASAEAMEPTEAWIVTRETFVDLIRHNPRSSLALISFLCAKLRTNLDRMEDFIFRDAYHRIGRQIIRMAPADVNGPCSISITQDELARLVGISREHVNRVLSDLSAIGYIATGRGKIDILNTVAMENLWG